MASAVLHLDDKEVRKALETLEKHGLLTKRIRSRAYFEQTLAPEKLSIDVNKIHFPSNLTKVSIYCFNKDIMFVLKARMFLLRKQVNDKV